MRLSVLAVLAGGAWLAAGAPARAQEQMFPQPEITEVAGGTAFDDEPTLARAADGSYYLAWISFRGGADTLQLARYQRRGERFAGLGNWQVTAGNGTALLGPRLVAAESGVYLLYALEQNRDWEIYAVPCSAAGPGTPVNISRHPATDVKPDGVWSDGALRVVWESNRDGARRILAASLRDGRVSPPEMVSPEGRSNYGPSIAAGANGRLYVAWHSFRANNYDIYLRRRSTGAAWDPVERLTRAPSIDRHAVLMTHGDDLWLAYENALLDGYRIGQTNTRRLLLARLDARGPRAPAGAPLEERRESPALAFDRQGRLWMAYLRPRLPRGGWDLFLAGYSGEKWLGPARISLRKGMDRRPSLILEGDYAVLAFQSDNFPESWAMGDPASTRNARSRVALAVVDLRNVPAAAPQMQLEPLVEPDASFQAGSLRVNYGEDAPTPTIQYQGRTLKLFYGDMHAHSDVSVCVRCGDQSLDENYQHRRDINRLDFVAMTDHDYNIVPYLWAYSAKMVRANEDSGRLLTFLAQEWTSSFEKYSKEHPYGYYGHRNLILADPFFPKWFDSSNGDTPAQLWAALRRMRANFVNIPHQLADTGNVPTDWNFTDEQAQPVAEIFQIRGSYEHQGAPREAARTTPTPGYYLQDAWAQGKIIGVIASPDHGGGLGKACVYAPELTRAAVLAAIRERHTFGTTAVRIFLDVRVNGRLMGEKIPAPDGQPVVVQVHVRCPSDIARVEICRNNQFLYTAEPEGRQADLSFRDTAPLAGRSYYYVRVVQKDNELAWSSPVWLGAK